MATNVNDGSKQQACRADRRLVGGWAAVVTCGGRVLGVGDFAVIVFIVISADVQQIVAISCAVCSARRLAVNDEEAYSSDKGRLNKG